MRFSGSPIGDSYCLILIAPTVSARTLFDIGVRDHIDLVIELKQPAYATAQLFHHYITEVFFPALETNRQLPGCENKLCILFCDFKGRCLKILRQQGLD
jgi:hypothetical protein